MKNSLYFVALLFVSGLTFGQGDTRGVNGVEVTKDSTTIGKIRGVIVGVSKYANLPQGNQLKFADADAESMYEYLSVHQQTDRSNLYLLKNEEVSFQNFKGRFVEAFRHSKEGDVLVIYFAGHGNLQRGDNECFLLLHGIKENDTEYFIDDEAVPLSLLQKYEAQCVAKKIRFLLIIDACHAGKILSETGSNTTAAVLNATWENSLKLISCGPKQLSYEYADLGGGHGVFTYYLLESFKKAKDTLGRESGIIEPTEFEGLLKSSVYNRTKTEKTPQRPSVIGDMPLFQFPSVTVAKNSGGGSEGTRRPSKLDRDGSSTGGIGRGWGSEDAKLLSSSVIKAFYESLDAKYLVENSFEKLKSEVVIGKSSSVKSYRKQVSAIAPLPEGNYVAIAGGDDPKIRIYDVEGDGIKPVAEFSSDGAVGPLVFSPDSKILVAGSRNAIQLWDWSEKKKINSTKPQNSGVRSLEISHDGKTLLSGDYSGGIMIWSFPALELIAEIDKAHGSEVTRIRFLASDSAFATASRDTKVKLWNLRSARQVFEFSGHKASVRGLEIDPRGNVIYTADEKGIIIRWSLNNGKVEQSIFKVKDNQLYDLSLSTDGKYVLAGGWSSRMDLLTTQPLALAREIKKSNLGISQLWQSPSGKFMLAGNFNGELIRIEMTRPLTFANLLYERIESIQAYQSVLSDIRIDFTTTLLSETQRVIQAMASGKDVWPTAVQVKKALVQLEYLNRMNPGNFAIQEYIEPRLRYLKGMEIVASNDASRFDEAIGFFESILKLTPDATYPHNALALVYKNKNDLEKANAKLLQAGNQLPKWTEPKSGLGQTKLMEGNFTAARENFDKIVQLEPGITKGHRWLGELELQQGNLVAAESHFAKALKIEPANPLLLARMAEIQQQRGKYKSAETLLTQIIKKDSMYYLPYLDRGNLHVQFYTRHDRSITLLKEAYADITKAIQLADHDPATYLAMGTIYRTLARYVGIRNLKLTTTGWGIESDSTTFVKRGLDFFDQSIRLAPHAVESYYQKALFLSAVTRNMNAALEVMADQKKVNPNGYAYMLNTGRFWLENGRPDLSEASLTSAARSFPNFAEPQLYLNEVYKQTANEKALLTISKSLNPVQKTNAIFIISLASALATSPGGVTEARSLLTDLLVHDPENKIAVTLLKNLKSDVERRPDRETEFMYQTIQPLNNVYCMVTFNSKKFLADNLGQIVVAFDYDKIIPLAGNSFMVSKQGKWGISNLGSTSPVNLQFDKVEVAGRYIKVYEGDKVGLMNENLKQIVSTSFQEIVVQETFIAIRIGNKWGATDFNGKTLVRPVYDNVRAHKHLLRNVIAATVERQSQEYYFTYDGECLNCK